MDTKKLRQKILDLAIRGKLVPQDPNDEPASVLLERIRAEKEQLIKEGKNKRSKKSVASDTSHYENVPFEVPESWCWVTLADISNYGECVNVPVNKIPDNSWILELEDIEKDSGRLIQRRIKSNRIINGVRHSFSKSNVLYSKLRTYLNKVLIADQDGYCTTEIMPITCKKGIMPEYLCHVLRSNYYVGYTTSLGYGVKMPRLGTNDALKSMIPVPPTSEQARIVSAIDRLSSTIDVLEVNQQDALDIATRIKTKILDLALTGKLVPQDQDDEPAIELLRKINPSFTPADNRHYGNTKITIPRNWCWVKLGEIFDVVSAKRVFQSEWQKTGIPFYRAREIVKLSNCGHVDNELYISIEHFESLKNKYGAPEADDIMLSAVGTIGKCYIVNKNDRFYYKDASVLCLKNIHNLNSEYIKFVLDSSVVQMQMQDQSKGTTVDTITIEKAKGYYIPLPPVTEQSRIVKAITLINHTIDKTAAIL